ncbi:transmembrane protein 6/97 [Xylaria sp. CBS 124048]|nr:transmembrane protein 6/97 [Xylaria sp. CBS 124048]
MASRRSILNRVYLVYFLIHIPVMFFVDLVPLYPSSLWQPRDSPLHFLSTLRDYYLNTYNDQFFRPPPAPIPTFFPLFAYLELIFHLPISLWAVRVFLRAPGGKSSGSSSSGSSSSSGRSHLSGSAELLLLVYGIETALTTFTCMYDAAHWDAEVVTFGQKKVLIGGLYGGYFALAVLLTVDMYTRVLNRLNVVDAVKKAQ